MSFRRSLALAAATLTLATGAGAQPRTVASRSVDATQYHFVMVTDKDGTPALGTVTFAGDRARMELAHGSHVSLGGDKAKARADQDGNSWFLLSDGGRRIAIVDPDKERYQEMDASTFTDVIGKVMRVMDTFMTMEVKEPKVTVQKVGDGGTVAGVRTERWAVTQEFTTSIGMFGKTSQELHRIVTDYWVAPGMTLPDNPLFELVTRGEAALAQADRDYVARVAKARTMLPRGAALRVLVTSASSDLSSGEVKAPTVRRLEVTDLRRVSIDEGLLSVPEGYEKSKSTGFNIDF